MLFQQYYGYIADVFKRWGPQLHFAGTNMRGVGSKNSNAFVDVPTEGAVCWYFMFNTPIGSEE